MPPVTDLQQLAPQITRLLKELDERATKSAKNNRYYEGDCPIPDVIATARLTNAYRLLMPMSEAPWASLVVDSVQDRLEVGGIRTGDARLDNLLWEEVWQRNGLDAESKLGHNGSLVDGRVAATIWPGDDGRPEVVFDPAAHVVVEYIEGRHQARHRIGALRRWIDEDDRTHITLYRREAIYKFSEAKREQNENAPLNAGGTSWVRRIENDRDGQPEEWPLPNTFDVLPVVELGTNRRLRSGPFPYARGEFEHCTGLIDRINLLTFLGLVVAVWMGFPLRGVIGEEILRDDNGDPLPPFDQKPDEVVQFENPNAKVFEFKAADRKNLSIFPELSQLAYVTKTPAHYFPLEQGMSNISAETVDALEGGLHAKVTGIHQPFLGEGHETVFAVAGKMLDKPVELPPSAAIRWQDHESRSWAERADAATKAKGIGLPTLWVAEKFLNLTHEDSGRLRAELAGTALDRLISDAENQPDPTPEPDPGDPAPAV